MLKFQDDPTVYSLRNPVNYIDGFLSSDTDVTSANAVAVASEHVLQCVIGRNFLEFVQSPQMDLADGNGVQFANLPSVPFEVLAQWADVPYAQ